MKGESHSHTQSCSWFHREIAWGKKENWCALECTACCTRTSSWGSELVFSQEEHWPWGRISVHSSSEIRNRVLIASFCLQGWGYHIFQSRLPKPFFSYSYFLLCKKWVIKLLLRPLLPKVDIKSIIICYLFLCYLYIFKLSIIISVWWCRSLCICYCKTEVQVFIWWTLLSHFVSQKSFLFRLFFFSFMVIVLMAPVGSKYSIKLSTNLLQATNFSK